MTSEITGAEHIARERAVNKAVYRVAEGTMRKGLIWHTQGSGKSLTMKAIAGLMTPDSGKVVLHQRALFDHESNTNLRPQQRKVGYLFQDSALCPHLTVAQNIYLGREVVRGLTLDDKAMNEGAREAVRNAFNKARIESRPVILSAPTTSSRRSPLVGAHRCC